MKQSPIIYLISGCNGAGKTTFDRGLSLLDPKATPIEAARFLLAKVKESIAQQKMFASTHCGYALRLSLGTLFALLQKELRIEKELGIGLWLTLRPSSLTLNSSIHYEKIIIRT